MRNSTQKQPNVQQQLQQSRAEISEMQARTSQTDFVVYLTNMVAQQQTMITNMNLELFNIGTKHRADLLEVDVARREEREAMEQEITALREQEMLLQQKANEWRAQRDKLTQQVEDLRVVVQAKQQQLEEVAKQEERPAFKKVRLIMPASAALPKVKVESGAEDHPGSLSSSPPTPPTTVENDEALYSWRAVEENNAHCCDMYGFTGPQLETIISHMGDVLHPKSNRGPKPTFGQQQFFLTFMYHFTHYTTLSSMHKKFGISKSALSDSVLRLMEIAYRDLFFWSLPSEPIQRYVDATYFFAVNTPNDTNIARALFDQKTRRHGLNVHCVHDLATHKVVAYQVLSVNQDVDAEWLANFQPLAKDAVLVAAYEKRMRGKFAVANTRYRGSLKEFAKVAGCLLALVNIDIGYDNPVVVREILTL